MTVLENAQAKLAVGAMLTIPEASALLGVARKTVEGWRYRQRAGLRAPGIDFRRYGGALRVTAESVRLVMQGDTPSTAAEASPLRLVRP